MNRDSRRKNFASVVGQFKAWAFFRARPATHNWSPTKLLCTNFSFENSFQSV